VDFLEGFIGDEILLLVGLWNLMHTIVMFVLALVVVVRTLECRDLDTSSNVCASLEEGNGIRFCSTLYIIVIK